MDRKGRRRGFSGFAVLRFVGRGPFAAMIRRCFGHQCRTRNYPTRNRHPDPVLRKDLLNFFRDAADNFSGTKPPICLATWQNHAVRCFALPRDLVVLLWYT
jgi:hypothetical protein